MENPYNPAVSPGQPSENIVASVGLVEPPPTIPWHFEHEILSPNTPVLNLSDA